MNSPIAPLLWFVFWYCRLAVAIRVPVSYDDAPGSCQGPTPSKVVLCYYEGHVALERLDPCLCSHLVLTSAATINPQNYTLNFTTDVRKATRELRRRNSDLQVLVSVGGSRVPTETAEALVKSADRRAAFALSVARNIQDADLNGVELDLRLDARGGSKYSKRSLVSLAKLLRKEMRVERSHRSRRDYAVFEQVDDISTTAWTPPRRYGTRDVRKAEPGVTLPHRTILRSVRTETQNDATEMLRQRYLALERRTSSNRLLLISVPTQPEILVKRFDLKTLTKYVDYFTIPSHNLTDHSENGLTYHPSRLMGLADTLNTDSILDLVTGLGAPHEKLIISIPATVTQFTLTDAKQNTPRSPAADRPVHLTQTELCTLISAGGWTIERDEDLTAPYAFKNTTWLAFDDSISVGIKSKYVLLRDLAGAAVHTVDNADWSGACMEDNSTDIRAPQLLYRLYHTFTALARKSRGALLDTLQDDIRTSTLLTFSGDVQLSPYRIVRIIDNQGAVHVVRKDARTEFECSRQGYFRHPLGCNRFYRCVKFNQYSADFTVFEYDCPSGLAFDERWEVCVWPGSLPEGACQGSSEIAPVPRARYTCPNTEGYYADPENCRWFFACLDHARDGVTPLTAYEFRCPFGLVFDEQNLLCQWPWLVDGCGNSGLFARNYFGAAAFGNAARRGYVSAARETSGSTFVATGDLGLRSGVGVTSSVVPAVLRNGAGPNDGYGTDGILLTDVNAGGNVGTLPTYIAGASRGKVKYSGASGEQIANSYILGRKETDSLANAGSYNEGRHISSYASFPDSYVSGGRIENSDGYVLGEHFGVHQIGTGFGVRSGGPSDTSDTPTAGIIADTDSSDVGTFYSSSDEHHNEGEYFSGSVLSSTPTPTVVKSTNIPVFPVTTLKKPNVAQIPIVQPIATHQQTVVVTPQAPVVPVTTFSRPAVAKVEPAAVPVVTYQHTAVETPQAPVVPVTSFTRPAVAKVEPAAVPVVTYQQTVVETPQAPVVPVTTFSRPAVAKVEPAAVPVVTYQQTVVENRQVPVVPVTSFTRPAVAKVEPAAVPVVTYQQIVAESPEKAAIPVYPAVTPLQQAVPVTPHVKGPTVSQTSIVDTAPLTTYLEETPVVPAVSIRTRLQPVSYHAPNIPVAKPIVPVVNTYLSTPVPTVAPIQSDFAEIGSARFAATHDKKEHSFHRRPFVSVATDGAAGISIPLVSPNVDTFGVVVNDNRAQLTPAPAIKSDVFPSGHSYTTPATSIFTSSSVPLLPIPNNSSSGYVSSTPAPSILVGSSIPVAPVQKSQTATGRYSYYGPAISVFTGTPPSVTPFPVLQSRVSSGTYAAPAVSSVRYSYSSPAPTVFTSGAVSLNAAPPFRQNGESYSFQSSGTVTADTIPLTNARVTPTVGYSYPKPSTPFITRTAATFRGAPLDSELRPALLDSSIGLASGLEIPSSTAGPTTMSSVTRKPYTTRVGVTTFISPPTSNIQTANAHDNTYVPSSATASPDILIPTGHTLNQKAILSSTVEPIHSVPFVDGRFGARTPSENGESAVSYHGAVGREKFVPQINVTYGASPATAYTAGSSFIYDVGQAQRHGRPYSGHVSSTTFPVSSAPGPSTNFISSTTRPVTYTPVVPPKSYATVLPAVKTTYVSSTLPIASVTSAPVLQSTSSDYKDLEGYGLRVGQSASRRKPTIKTPINYDNENVEVLLDKYSGKFGGLLDNNKEGFISEVINDDLADLGKSRVSQGGIGDTLQRGNVDGVGLSGLNGRHETVAGYSDEGSNTVFGTRTGFSTTSATSTGSSTLRNTADGAYISTTASPGRGGPRGKIRYGTNTNIDADGGIGYEAITVEQEGTKSRSKEEPVVVITRLSDVNPLLIAKLGAQCTCKSNTVTLKRPGGYPRGGNAGSKLLLISSPTLQDDITSRSETYNVPEHVPSAPLPGSNIVTGSSPDITLGLNDGIPSLTSVNLDPVSFAIPKASEFLKAIGQDETGVTPAAAVLVTTFRPHIKLSEVKHTTAKPVNIASPVRPTTDARSRGGIHVVSTPLVPLVEVSPSIPTTIGVTSHSRAQVPLVVSTTALPIQVTGVPDIRRVASVSGGHPKTGCPDSSVEVAGSARGLDVDGRTRGAPARVAIGAGRSFDRYGPGGWRGLDETLQGSVDCQRAGLFRHPKYCNKFYACHWDEWKGRYTLHVFNCPVHLAYDSSLGACNWPSKGPACSDDTLLV